MSSFKKTVLAVVLLLILGIGAYFLATSEYFKGIIARLDPSTLQMHKVRDSVTVRTTCADGEDFCTWPMETKKETSFNVVNDAVFEVLQKPDGAPSGTLRALKADFDVQKLVEMQAGNFHYLVDKSTAANTEITEWCWKGELNGRTVNRCINDVNQFSRMGLPELENEYSFSLEYTVRDAVGRSDSVTKTVTIPAREKELRPVEKAEKPRGQGEIPAIIATCAVEEKNVKQREYSLTGGLAKDDSSAFAYVADKYKWEWLLDDTSNLAGNSKEGQSIEYTFTPGTHNPILRVTKKDTTGGNFYTAQCKQVTAYQPGPILQDRPDTGAASPNAADNSTDNGTTVIEDPGNNSPTPADIPAGGRGAFLRAKNSGPTVRLGVDGHLDRDQVVDLINGGAAGKAPRAETTPPASTAATELPHVDYQCRFIENYPSGGAKYVLSLLEDHSTASSADDSIEKVEAAVEGNLDETNPSFEDVSVILGGTSAYGFQNDTMRKDHYIFYRVTDSDNHTQTSIEQIKSKCTVRTFNNDGTLATDTAPEADDAVTTAAPTEPEPAAFPGLSFLNESKTILAAFAGATVYFEADCLDLNQALKIFPLTLQSAAELVHEEQTVDANRLLQQLLQQQQQTLQTMSNASKQLHDAALNTVRKIGSNPPSNPGAALIRSRIPADMIERPAISGKIEQPESNFTDETAGGDTRNGTATTDGATDFSDLDNARVREDTTNDTTSTEVARDISSFTATLGIKANEFACTPVTPEVPACKNEDEILGTPADVCCEGLVVGPDDYNDVASWGRCQAPQPTVPQPVTPVCKVDKNTILTGEDIIFTGKDSSGPYTDATLDFGDGTIIELNVPKNTVEEVDNTRAPAGREGPARFNNLRTDGEFAESISSARRIPMKESLARKREVPPSVEIKAEDIDQVQTFQPHTYSAAGTFTITLTLNDAAGQTYACNQTVTVADPVPPTVDTPPTPPQCADGLDNDGDGFTDFIVGAGDPGCEDAADNNETNPDEPIADEPHTVDTTPRLPFCLAYTDPQRYIDVSPEAHAYDVIKEESSTAYNGAYDDFVGQAIFHGYPSKNNKRIFRPQQGILRSEAAKIIMHATCYADSLLEYGLLDATDVPYKDVPADHWADQIINILSNAGIFDADLEYNNPNSHTTRAEFIKLLVEVHVQTIGDELHAFRPEDNPFVDVEADAWYAPYIQTAVDYGIALESDDFTFRPDRIVTREDAAIWIKNYFTTVADASFIEKREGEVSALLDEEEESVLPPIAR